jgi:hypothetical protein
LIGGEFHDGADQPIQVLTIYSALADLHGNLLHIGIQNAIDSVRDRKNVLLKVFQSFEYGSLRLPERAFRVLAD